MDNTNTFLEATIKDVYFKHEDYESQCGDSGLKFYNQ